MTAKEELAVIARVLGGERDAFEALVLDNQTRVYNLALKLTGNENDALDVSQEAFIKAYTSLPGFRGESRFSVWMYRMTYNLCVDLLRKRSRRNEASLTYRGEDGEDSDFQIPDMRSMPEDKLIDSETRAEISRSIDELLPKYREILVMREIAGMSYDEIARTLSINPGTVKSRLARARTNLAALLNKKGTFPPGFRQKNAKEVEGLD